MHLLPSTYSKRVTPKTWEIWCLGLWRWHTGGPAPSFTSSTTLIVYSSLVMHLLLQHTSAPPLLAGWPHYSHFSYPFIVKQNEFQWCVCECKYNLLMQKFDHYINLVLFFCSFSDAGIGSGSLGSSISSLGDSVSRADSLEVPWGPGRPLAWEMPPRVLSSTHSEGDSGIGGPSSPYSSTCGSFLSPPSLSSTPHGTPTSRQG